MTHFDQRGQRVDTQVNIGRDLNIIVPPVPKGTIQEERNRRVLLARVESNWITTLLSKLLAEQVEITLRLQRWPQAVENPLFDVVQELGEFAADSLLTDDQILQTYDEASGKLLILGEPGSGKTTLLLKLLRELLPHAFKDELHPMPVLFLLSSWSVRKPALEDWLIQELHTKYDIPPQMASRWVAHHAILPLLDGLDEVEEHARAACINAINTYQDAHRTNFPPGSRIEFTSDATNIVYCGELIMVGRDGTFDGDASIPTSWLPGSQHVIKVQATGQDGHVLAQAQQTVTVSTEPEAIGQCR